MYKINNWSSLQSYKDRKPPWIRLHKTLLDNFEFHSLSKNARALLPMLWLLASEHNDPTSGIIKHSIDQISFRLRMSKKELIDGIKECLDAEFIEQYQLCNEPVTKPLQDGNSTVTPETETETETETYPVWLDEQTMKDFIAMRKQIKKPMTDRAVELLVMKLDKLRLSGHDPKGLLEKSTMNSWLDVYPDKNGGENKPRGPKLS